MLRFVRSTVPSSRLSAALFEQLLGHLKVCKEIIPQSIVNNVLQTNTALGSNYFMKFCTSAVTTANVDESSDEPNIAEVTGGDAELDHKLRVLILEAEVWRQEGKAVPNNSSIKTANWQELLKLPSKSARKKYLEFLFKLEKKKENILKKKEEKRLAWEQNPKPKRDAQDVLSYELGCNQFLLRIYDTTMNQLYNNRLVQAMQFGQKLIVDCGYDENMTVRENSNCAKQLMLLFAENRMNDEPFDLHYCNANRDSGLMKGLHKFIVTMYEPSFPLHLHEQSYLDIFPKDKLVYLTPHCREVMTEYDHDAVYIIGAIVDKVNNEPLSLAKAKKEGLRMAKLPLDHYLEWGAGSGKSLTINQVISILLDVKRTGDWKYALRHVPRRKLVDQSLLSTTKKFTARSNYIKQAPRPNSLRWKPSSNNNFDELKYKRKEPYADQEERKKSTSRLIDVRKVVN